MKYNDVLKIIKDFENTSLTSLELEIEDIKVKMTKNTSVTKEVVSPVVADQTTIKEKAPVQEEKPAGFLVKSPLVGTYYSSASPEASPFVRVGDKVKKGDTLCIIEAMKIMNEISAPVAGTITSIKAKNSDTIGYDQVLMTIDNA
ncbi:MAG: acetyl-CoA carboxylase biotin carboxyl carrier protein [Candidatus Izemoplasmatales bacterium]